MLFMAIPSPDLAELAVRAGMHDVVLDCEHGFPVGQARSLLLGCRAAGGRCLVRIPITGASELASLADLGLDGVVLSAVRSVAEAQASSRFVSFPTAGVRSINPFVPAAGAPGDLPGLLASALAFEIWIMAETRELLLELTEPASSTRPAGAGLDPRVGMIIGPYDLAGALGCAPDPDDAVLQGAVRRLGDYARTTGRRWALFVRNVETWARWVALGVDPPAVVLGYDRDIWFQQCAARVNRVLGPVRPQ